jgi:Pre-mRNA 3'-end-processing endonuclease polyadenylation factor C-term
MHAQSSSASIRLTSKPCRHPRDMNDIESNKKVKGDDIVASRLRFILALLQEQFKNVDSTFDGLYGDYEIVTDAGLESEALDEDGKLRCAIRVELNDSSASGATITVKCADQKLAANVRSTLQNAIVAAAAVKTKID